MEYVVLVMVTDDNLVDQVVVFPFPTKEAATEWAKTSEWSELAQSNGWEVWSLPLVGDPATGKTLDGKGSQ